MPEPGSASHTLSLAALGETVDLLGVVVARMSEKLDQHGETLVAVQQTALESRDAAQAARTHTDPKRYASHIGHEVYNALGESLDRLETLQESFATDRQDTSRILGELARQEEQALQRLRDELARAGRWKQRILFMAAFGLVLALGLTIALPRFTVADGFGCIVLGGEWLQGPETGKEACVFYAR